MVKSYKNKSDRRRWNDGDMHLAIESVLEHGKSCKSAAQVFNVPRSTLQKKIKILVGSVKASMIKECYFVIKNWWFIGLRRYPAPCEMLPVRLTRLERESIARAERRWLPLGIAS